MSLDRRALIGFDVSGLVEAGSTIDSVFLHMTVTRAAPATGPRRFDLHRVPP